MSGTSHLLDFHDTIHGDSQDFSGAQALPGCLQISKIYFLWSPSPLWRWDKGKIFAALSTSCYNPSNKATTGKYAFWRSEHIMLPREWVNCGASDGAGMPPVWLRWLTQRCHLPQPAPPLLYTCAWSRCAPWYVCALLTCPRQPPRYNYSLHPPVLPLTSP